MRLSRPPRTSTGMAWPSSSSPMRLARSSPPSAAPSMRSTLLSRLNSARNLNLLSGNTRGKELDLAWWICTRRLMILVELKEAEEKSLKESERLEEEVAEVQELKISTMTADEYFEKHPELKKKFDDEIRNDEWGY